MKNLLAGFFPDGRTGAILVDKNNRPFGPVWSSSEAVTSFQSYIGNTPIPSLGWGDSGYGWGLVKEWLGAGSPSGVRPLPVYTFEEHVKWEPENGMWLFERDVAWDCFPRRYSGDEGVDRTNNLYVKVSLVGAAVLWPGEAGLSQPEFLYVLLESEKRAKAFIDDLNSFLATWYESGEASPT